mgnify:FL=1
MLTATQIKEKYNIDEVLSISNLTVNNSLFSLYFNSEDGINYTALTDGDIEHMETWMLKHPSQFDPFLKDCSLAKRFIFKLENANLLLLEKKKKEEVIKRLYINEDKIDIISISSIYKISIGKKENIKIRKLKK